MWYFVRWDSEDSHSYPFSPQRQKEVERAQILVVGQEGGMHLFQNMDLNPRCA